MPCPLWIECRAEAIKTTRPVRLEYMLFMELLLSFSISAYDSPCDHRPFKTDKVRGGQADPALESGNSSPPRAGSADLCLLDRFAKNLTAASTSKNPATHRARTARPAPSN